MRTRLMITIAASGMLAGASPAATLVHDYEFTNGVQDSVGAANGTLHGDATVSAGRLNLTGGGWADLNSQVLPVTGAFSLYVSFIASPQQRYYTEMVSQGYSGQPGFYLGIVGNDIRLTDYYGGGVGHAFPKDGTSHDILLTTRNGSSQLFVDGGSVWSAAGNVNPGNMFGANTVFGGQFGGNWESFVGSLDAVRIFDGVATYAEATAAPAPEPASWAMMLGGFALVGATMRSRRRAGVTFG